MKSRTIFFISALAAVACNYPLNTMTPEAAATKWVGDMGLKTQGTPNCTQVDTDNDGYVTCTVAVVQSDAAPKLFSLQCAVITNPPTGCGQNVNTQYALGCKETVIRANIQQ